jgi:hypothetical protein
MELPPGATVILPRRGPAWVESRTGNVLLEIRPASAEGRTQFATLLIDIFGEITIEGYGRRDSQ